MTSLCPHATAVAAGRDAASDRAMATS